MEQGRYAEAIASTGAEPELVNTRTPDVTFADVTATAFPQTKLARSAQVAAGEDLAAAVAGGVTLLDVDGDGDLDVIGTAPRGRGGTATTGECFPTSATALDSRHRRAESQSVRLRQITTTTVRRTSSSFATAVTGSCGRHPAGASRTSQNALGCPLIHISPGRRRWWMSITTVIWTFSSPVLRPRINYCAITATAR